MSAELSPLAAILLLVVSAILFIIVQAVPVKDSRRSGARTEAHKDPRTKRRPRD